MSLRTRRLMSPDPVTLARAHGLANIVFGGLWPLLHMRSFEAVFGPKTDRWLVRTVAGLLLANGVALLSAPPTSAGMRQARLVGIGTSAVLASIDLVYAPRGRISRMYLGDAVVEVAWILLWSRARPAPAPHAPTVCLHHPVDLQTRAVS